MYEWGLYHICLRSKPPSVIEWGVWISFYSGLLVFFRPLALERLLERVFGFMFLTFCFGCSPRVGFCVFSLYRLQACLKPPSVSSGGMFVLLHLFAL